jgi:hypothetical protein
MNDLSDAIFALGPHIRYVAYGSGQNIELSQREGVLALRVRPRTSSKNCSLTRRCSRLLANAAISIAAG